MTDQPQPLAPGVYGVIGPNVNAYLLDDAGSLVLIDAGMPGSASRILALIDSLGRAPGDVTHILITHADIDHVGGLKPLADATGATVVASAESARYIRKRRNPPHLGFPANVFSNVVSFLARRAAPVGRVVADGDVLDIAGGIRVIATPGHTPDHVSYFWERERVLFAGDLLNMRDGLNVTPPRITWDTAAARRSVQGVAALAPAIICVGHGPVWRAEDDPGRLEALSQLP